MRREIFVLPAIILIILGALLLEKLQPQLDVHTIVILSAGGINAGDNATDFILESLNGSDIRLGSFAGKKAVILHFWSSNSELANLQTVRNFYGDRVEILGINSDANTSNIRKAAVNVNFPILLDTGSDVKRAYGVSTLPTTYFVNLDGSITDKKEGPLEERELNEKVKNLIR